MASEPKSPTEGCVKSVLVQVKEVWLLRQFQQSRCGLCLSLHEGGVASVSLSVKERSVKESLQ